MSQLDDRPSYATTGPPTRETPGAPLIKRALRFYWPTLIVVALIISLAAATIALFHPPEVRSTAKVLLRPAAGTPYSTQSAKAQHDPMVGLETEAKLVTSSDVTRRAARLSPKTLRPDPQKVEATVVPNTQVIEISYHADSTPAAKTGANAYAQGLLDSREDLARTTREAKIATLKKQISTTSRQIKTAVKGADAKDQKNNDQLRELIKNLGALKHKLAGEETTSIDPGQIVGPASSPTRLQQIATPIIVVLGVVFGLALGLAAAALRARSDDRVGKRESQLSGIRVWSRLTGSDCTPGSALVVDSPNATAKESYALLRTAVVANIPSPSVIALTSTEPLSAVAKLTANLAVKIRRSGYSVAVIDLNSEQPSILSLFDLDPKTDVGISDVVTGSVTLDAATLQSHEVSLVGAGTDARATREGFDGPALKQAISDMSQAHDYVIIAAAPLSSSVGIAGAAAAGNAILIVPESAATAHQVAELTQRLDVERIQIKGIVTVSGHGNRVGTRVAHRHSSGTKV